MQIILIKKAGTGETMFVNRGPKASMPKIPNRTTVPWGVCIPKSACRNTITDKRTTTPTILLSAPNIFVYRVTKRTQKETVSNILNK